MRQVSRTVIDVNLMQDRMQVRGLTPERMALKIGVSETTMERWIAGESGPRPCYREPLAKLLGVGTGLLFSTVHPSRRKPHKTRANGRLQRATGPSLSKDIHGGMTQRINHIQESALLAMADAEKLAGPLADIFDLMAQAKKVMGSIKIEEA